MVELILDCPHCDSENTGMEFIGERAFVSSDRRRIRRWNTFWECRKCREGVVVKFSGAGPWSDGAPSQAPGDPRDSMFELITIFPPRREPSAPENTPDGIAGDFLEAEDNMRRRNWTSAGMMYRKVLQRSTTQLAPAGVDFTRMNLMQRIDVLAENHLITPAMRDWAQIVRLDGNEATHEEEEEFSPEKASQMRYFTELFLTYAFTLPARVEAFRNRTLSG